MIKYIDLELALNELLRLYEEDVDEYGVEIPETFDYHRAREVLLNLPTIEVSDDCISREWVLDKLNEQYKVNRFREHNDMANFGIRQEEIIIEDAPSVVPISENKCHRHEIRLEDGTPIYECIGCDEQDCERK